MLKTILTHTKERIIIKNNELKIRVYKSLMFHLESSKKINTIRYLSRRKCNFQGYSSASRTRSICLVSGRTRSIYRQFRLSRHMIRFYGGAGLLNGLSKSSW